jgi:hypothetical protein
MSRAYKNTLNLRGKAYGQERRKNLAKEILKDSTPLPKTLLYKDIDKAFSEWVENDLRITFDGQVVPTMSLYSNQRFSEYMQTWDGVDEKKNIILNFKAITRENNPKLGTIVGQSKNIPGEHSVLMKTVEAFDKNNRKYYIDYRLKQPTAIDFIYTVSLVTNKYELLNEFNLMMNDKFKAIQCYIRPNDHFIPMILNDISDESEYSIDNRQYYSQTYNITVKGYIITEDDYIVEERPEVKILGYEGDKSTYADIEEFPICTDEKTEYDFIPINITVCFDSCKTSYKFTIDTDFQAKKVIPENVRSYRVFVNDIETIIDENFKVRKNDVIHFKGIVKNASFDISRIKIEGFKHTEAYHLDEDIEIKDITHY